MDFKTKRKQIRCKICFAQLMHKNLKYKTNLNTYYLGNKLEG